MFHPKNLRRRGLHVPLCSVLALFASCNDPQSPVSPGGDTTYRGLYDSGGNFEFNIETPGGDLSALRLVARDLIFDVSSQQLHAQVSILNTGSEALPGPNAVLIDEIDPESVVPVNALPLRCPTPLRCLGGWEYIHEGTYGGDAVLSPGETSSPIEWIFADSTGQGFSFRAALRTGDATRSGVISGSVFADANGDGRRQASESGLAGVAVTLVHGDSTTTIATGTTGGFEFQVGEAGLYEVLREASADCDPTTPSRRQVFIVMRPDGSLSGYSGLAFGCRSSFPDENIVVTGIVFEDQNRDGHIQDGEKGLAGVLITGAGGCPTFAPIQTHTDRNGRYALRLVCWPVVITREPLPGFVDTTPNPVIFPGPPPPLPVPEPPSPPGDSPVVTLRANFGVARVDSSLQASVEGFVFEDSNHNGLRDGNESGIPGVEVTAQGLSCMTPIIGVTHTDALGHYLLRQPDVHCQLPWRVGHAAVEGMCDTSPNPVDVGYDRRPDPRHYRVDFGVAPCDSLPSQGFLVVFVQWDGQGVPGRRLEIVELGLVQVTNGEGLARFVLLPGTYTLHADVNTPGPPIGVNLSVTVRRGQTTRVEIVDCLPCVVRD